MSLLESVRKGDMELCVLCKGDQMDYGNNRIDSIDFDSDKLDLMKDILAKPEHIHTLHQVTCP